ncbi:uncharacterized protein LOC135503242 [Lineus longissimus]|uniref:uncharacterized protein LOC135503242 n=1 Tax=Lineus longissimus TaxID=88925 RepID=UPI002B4D785F
MSEKGRTKEAAKCHTKDQVKGHTKYASKGHTTDPVKGHTKDASKGHTKDPVKGHTKDASNGHTTDPVKGHTKEASKGYTKEESTTGRRSDSAKGHTTDNDNPPSSAKGEKKEVDLTRPVFNRCQGQLGIYVDLIDVELIDPLAYGSERFMMISVADKLLECYQSIELCKIKSSLEKKELLKGTVLDGFITGLILSVTFDNLEAVETFWHQYKSGEVGKFFKSYLETKSTKRYIEAKRLEIRIRCWEDEYEACKEDLLANEVIGLSLADHEYDIKMLRKARAWQQNYTKDLYKLRDFQYEFEAHLGEFINLCKTFQPQSLQEFVNIGDLEALIKRAKERKTKTVAILERYPNTFQAVRKCAKDMKKGIFHTVAEVHAGCESEKQRALKAKMNAMLADVMRMTEPCYCFRDTHSPVWEHKVMDYERKMFVGMVTTFPCVIETMIDVDHLVDDYYEDLKIEL